MSLLKLPMFFITFGRFYLLSRRAVKLHGKGQDEKALPVAIRAL